MDISLTEISLIIDKEKGSGYFAKQLEKPFGDFIKHITKIPDGDQPLQSPVEILMKDKEGKLLDWGVKAQERLKKNIENLGVVLSGKIKAIKDMDGEKFINSIFGIHEHPLRPQTTNANATEHAEEAVLVKVVNTDELATQLSKKVQSKPATVTQTPEVKKGEGEKGSLLSRIFRSILKWGAIGGVVLGLGHLWNTSPEFQNAIVKMVSSVVSVLRKSLSWLGEKFVDFITNKELLLKIGDFLLTSFIGSVKMAWSVLSTFFMTAFEGLGDAWGEGFGSVVTKVLKGLGTTLLTGWLLSKLPVVGLGFKAILSTVMTIVKVAGPMLVGLLVGVGKLIGSVAVSVKNILVKSLPLIKSGLKGIGKLLLMAGKQLLLAGRFLLMNPIAAVVASTAIAAAAVTKSIKAFKGMRQEQKEAEQAERDFLNYKTRKIKEGADKVKSIEQKISEMKQFDPETEKERIEHLKTIHRMEKVAEINRITAAQRQLDTDSERGKERFEKLRKELAEVRQSQLLDYIERLGDTGLTQEIKSLMEQGYTVGGKHNQRFNELRALIYDKFDKQTGELIKAVEKQTKETENVSRAVLEGAALQAGATQNSGNQISETVRSTNSQAEINVKSTVEFERIFGFREMARSFIYPERIGFKSL